MEFHLNLTSLNESFEFGKENKSQKPWDDTGKRRKVYNF